jgi:hypothetical protein
MTDICRICGSTESQTIADARTLGLLNELQSGMYSCCQIVAWADEQWLAWLEAAEEDGKLVDEVTKPLEPTEGEPVVVRVSLPVPPDGQFGDSFDSRRA